MMKSYDCVYEKQIQGQSRKIAELETRADFKDKRIDEWNLRMDKMENKLDKLNDNVNALLLQTNQADNDLELRLKAIETELALQKQTAKVNHNRFVSILSVVGVGLTILTILINVYFHSVL